MTKNGFVRTCAWVTAIMGGIVACGGESPPASSGPTTGTGGTASSAATGTGGGTGGATGAGTGGAGSGCSADSNPGGGPTASGAMVCKGAGARYVTSVVASCFGPGKHFGRTKLPGIVEGPPKGAGCCAGSLDVASLGVGGMIELAFAGNAIVDGPGPDFIVFENPFDIANDPTNPYAELATVAVSADGLTWSSFPCTATQYPYGGCAGWHPVFANPDANAIDPLDPKVAGGDAFDLADLGMKMARFVRITARPDDPNAFNLDAIGIVNAACP